MTKAASISPAISCEALYDKSRLYISRAIERKIAKNLDEYQLWASLALELLGKSVLSGHHPCLVVDPHHTDSLFAAAGIKTSTDLKTIGAHTIYERIKKISPRFDSKVLKFCKEISERRNVELHSGETPFRAMKMDVWEAQYWDAAQVILSLNELTLDAWLGADNVKAPKDIIEHAAVARRTAVTVRIQRFSEDFKARKKSDKDRLLADAKSKNIRQYPNLFSVIADCTWEQACPACGGKAFTAGIQISEDIIDTEKDFNDDNEFLFITWETVNTCYVAEQFGCPTCGLFLDGFDEIEAAEIETEHDEESQRRMDFEPEYGND